MDAAGRPTPTGAVSCGWTYPDGSRVLRGDLRRRAPCPAGRPTQTGAVPCGAAYPDRLRVLRVGVPRRAVWDFPPARSARPHGRVAVLSRREIPANQPGGPLCRRLDAIEGPNRRRNQSKQNKRVLAKTDVMGLCDGSRILDRDRRGAGGKRRCRGRGAGAGAREKKKKTGHQSKQ